MVTVHLNQCTTLTVVLESKPITTVDELGELEEQSSVEMLHR